MSLSVIDSLPSRIGLFAEPEISPAPAGLVAQVSDALEAAGIRYCQWKGHTRRERWSAGRGDLDLLVDRASAPALGIALERLGFKLALPSPELTVPGVVSYLGLDAGLGRLVHVHAHYQLILGSAWRRHYHLPIEAAVLEASLPDSPFRTPAPEHALLLFVLHQVLRYQLRHLGPGREPAWLRTIEPDLHRLESAADPHALAREVARLLPDLGPREFLQCLESLRPGFPPARRLLVRATLEWRLRTFLRRPPLSALLLRAAHRARGLGLPRSWRWTGGKRLAAGGAVVALVGADGAGKSTCAAELERWLAPELMTRRVHLGRPPRRWLTWAVGGALKAARRLEAARPRAEPRSLARHLELLRHVCTARDRYHLYRRVRRFVAQGGVALCERYPVPQSHALAGPSAAQGLATDVHTPFAAWLRRVEGTYYARIGMPSLLVVLRVTPEAAVRRKTDEPAEYVRARAELLQQVDWSDSTAWIVDAGRPLPDVLAELRFHLWERL